MSAWFAVAAPYIPEIIKLARPLFTHNSTQEKSIEIASQQIAELQTAALQNSESIKLLATEMQHTIEAMQNSAGKLEKKLGHAHVLLIISFTISVVAICVALYALAH